ncbi:MAG TPA: hypothetical protein VGL39_10830 [Jatrophihabitantaceae bacterium]|jgi:hypothetical protein
MTLDLGHHGDVDVAPGLVDLALNVRPGTPPAWLADAHWLRVAVRDTPTSTAFVEALHDIA